jgi:MoxR-like ATPase
MIVPDVLSHRIILNIEDTLEGARGESVVEDVVGQVPVPTDMGRMARQR